VFYFQNFTWNFLNITCETPGIWLVNLNGHLEGKYLLWGCLLTVVEFCWNMISILFIW
jgi:hypothetical protein